MDAALGCLLGAAVGDAAGATLEFESRAITADLATAAMGMPGGGVLGMGPGQVTDDTELALSLANGLLGHHPQEGFPQEAVSEQYYGWLRSEPFDVGGTCRAAFSAGPSAASMQDAALRHSADSKANGALMRVMPLAIWAHRMDDHAIATLAEADARLSHPNQVCQDCNAAYCLALAHLMQHPGDSQGAVERAEAWASRHATQEVQQWLLWDCRAADTAEVVEARQSIGFVRWGFTLAFHHLRRRSSYEEGVRATLCTGGDTDTNAAIVGGMLGALWGAVAIPHAMVQPVLGYSYPAQGPWLGYKRPAVLQGARIPQIAEALFRTGQGPLPSPQGD